MLKKVFNAFNSLSICISSSHSSNHCLTSYETLIPNNHFVWMKNGSYGWAYALIGPWFNSFDFCRAFHVLDALLLCIYVSCITIYALFYIYIYIYIYLTLLHLFCVSKNPKPHKKWKTQKVWSYMFEHILHVSLAQYLHTNGVVYLQV